MTHARNHISERIMTTEDSQCPCCDGVFYDEDKELWETVENPDTPFFGDKVCPDCWEEYRSEFQEAQSHVLRGRR